MASFKTVTYWIPLPVAEVRRQVNALLPPRSWLLNRGNASPWPGGKGSRLEVLGSNTDAQMYVKLAFGHLLLTVGNGEGGGTWDDHFESLMKRRKVYGRRK